ncbi:hypothetical protein [Moraxella lincolnii]|nr:hypothetical protein [Moraxella lincolnii]
MPKAKQRHDANDIPYQIKPNPFNQKVASRKKFNLNTDINP